MTDPGVARSETLAATRVDVVGLSKAYPTHRKRLGPLVLDDVSLSVNPGEFLVLLGASGCGKTTLLRSIAGLERPQQGSIYIGGEVVYSSADNTWVPPEQRPVSMIFQSYALWPHMTALENVGYPLKCRGVGRQEIKVRATQILDLLGLGELLDRLPGQMSGGQQQRLALARALVVDARVVLFDEPLSNVDAKVRDALRSELARMHRELGFTAIYVTHDQAEALELADRIAVVESGKILQIAEPEQLYTSPSSTAVARFIGQSNECRFVVEDCDQSTWRVSGRGGVGAVRGIAAQDGHASIKVGDEVIGFFRPHSVSIRPAIGGLAERDRQPAVDVMTWRGEVMTSRFLGPDREHVVNVGGHTVRAWQPIEDSTRIRPGDAVFVSVDAQAMTVVPVGSSSGTCSS